MKKIIDKKIIIGFILGGLIFGSIGVFATTIISGNNISYDNATSNLSSTNVQNALDELNTEVETGNHVWNKIKTDSELSTKGYSSVNSIDTLKTAISNEISSAVLEKEEEFKNNPTKYGLANKKNFYSYGNEYGNTWGLGTTGGSSGYAVKESNAILLKDGQRNSSYSPITGYTQASLDLTNINFLCFKYTANFSPSNAMLYNQGSINVGSTSRELDWSTNLMAFDVSSMSGYQTITIYGIASEYWGSTVRIYEVFGISV